MKTNYITPEIRVTVLDAEALMETASPNQPGIKFNDGQGDAASGGMGTKEQDALPTSKSVWED